MTVIRLHCIFAYTVDSGGVELLVFLIINNM